MHFDINVRSLYPPACFCLGVSADFCVLLQATALGLTKTSYCPLTANSGLTQF